MQSPENSECSGKIFNLNWNKEDALLIHFWLLISHTAHWCVCFHGRRLNSHINYADRSTSRIIYQDYKLSFIEIRNGRSVNHSNR